MLRLHVISMPMWFLHKDMFGKITIEEGIRHIKLMKRPPLIQCQRKNNTYRVKADHGRGGLHVVNPVSLGEPTSN